MTYIDYGFPTLIGAPPTCGIQHHCLYSRVRCLQTIRIQPDYSPALYRVTEVIQYLEEPTLLQS